MIIKTYVKNPKRGKTAEYCIFACDFCGATKECLVSQVRYKKRHFCNNVCRGKAGWTPETLELMAKVQRGKVMSQETKDKISISETGRVQSQETKDKIKAAHSTPEARELTRQQRLGKKHSEETKDKISVKQENRSPESRELTTVKLRGSKRTPKQCDNMSLAQAKAISEGKNTGYGLRGRYMSTKTLREECYDSLYERVFMMILDADPGVQTWTKRHGLVISYEFDGETLSYVPDFRLTCDNATVIAEIKGKEDDAKIAPKSASAIALCIEREWSFTYVNMHTLSRLTSEILNTNFKRLYRELRKQWHAENDD